MCFVNGLVPNPADSENHTAMCERVSRRSRLVCQSFYAFGVYLLTQLNVRIFVGAKVGEIPDIFFGNSRMMDL